MIKPGQAVEWFEMCDDMHDWCVRWRQNITSDGIHGGVRSRARPGSTEVYHRRFLPADHALAIEIGCGPFPFWDDRGHQAFSDAFSEVMKKYAPMIAAEVEASLWALRRDAAIMAREEARRVMAEADKEAAK